MSEPELSWVLANPASQAVFEDWQALAEQYQQAQVELLRLGHCAKGLLIPTPGPDRWVLLSELVCVESDSRRSRIHLSSGESFLSTTTFLISDAVIKLAEWPQFQRLTDTYLVNLDMLSQTHSHPERSRDYELVMRSGLRIPLPESRQPLLLRHLDQDSLRKVKSLEAQGGEGVYLDNLRPFPKQLRLMSKAELNQHFRNQRTGRFDTASFLSNYIWEYAQLLKLGQRPAIEGNIRTFWYILKPTLAKAIKLDSEKNYDQMLHAFQRLIVRYGMLKFRDFSFSDEGQRFYVPGPERINVLLVAEKKGHFRRLQALQEEFGTTIIALGGMPSLLNSEYFADHLSPQLKGAPLHVISLVDYNPAGALILRSFLAQLQHEGLPVPDSIQHLVVPDNFSADDLKAIAEPIPMGSKADRTKARRWIEAGGGIDGKPLGIESDALVLYTDRLKALITQALTNTEDPRSLTMEFPPKDHVYRPEALETEAELLGF